MREETLDPRFQEGIRGKCVEEVRTVVHLQALLEGKVPSVRVTFKKKCCEFNKDQRPKGSE